MTQQPHHYPETHAERLEWHERGTPPGFTPYTPDAPDPYRDGLLRGFHEHAQRTRRTREEWRC